ncbi:MAG: hypothetical protein K0Q74_1397 [Gammaproteobacteria bacterium]|jgi:hypothetical protein|nr:hypothetical protein [Gammaproteobacteria bacterium]
MVRARPSQRQSNLEKNLTPRRTLREYITPLDCRVAIAPRKDGELDCFVKSPATAGCIHPLGALRPNLFQTNFRSKVGKTLLFSI